MQCEFKYCKPVVWISRGTEMERPSSSLLGVISVGRQRESRRCGGSWNGSMQREMEAQRCSLQNCVLSKSGL